MASLAELSSREAVLAAMAEYDTLGRETFLRKYGYRYSRLYPLIHNGKRYDSKAIAGVAVGKQSLSFPLRSRDFSGGLATVVPLLRRLGFDVSQTPHPATFLTDGQTYTRVEFVDLFGGQLQRGIWTPTEFPAVLLFTGASGASYGYQDGWTEEGTFKYTGDGQVENMTFSSGNAAIRDHHQNGKDLLLFEDLGKGLGVRYNGMFDCASWEYVNGFDKEHRPRRPIVFDLVAIETPIEITRENTEPPGIDRPKTLEELRNAAYQAARTGSPEANGTDRKRKWYERNSRIKEHVLTRANGVCEACDSPTPFLRKDGTPYRTPSHHTTGR